MTNYTTVNELRKLITATATARAKAQNKEPDAVVLNNWITQRIEGAREAGLLMTDQQYVDHKTGRGFAKGDNAKYIGPTRTEKPQNVTAGAATGVQRPHGQLGRITSVVTNNESAIVTFRPLQPVGDDLCELVVREGTPGYLDIERVPGETP